MLKRVIRSGVAILVALSMLLIPNKFALNSVKAASIYDEAATKARQMAKVLTQASSYGEYSIHYALIDHGKIVISGQSGTYSKEEKMVLTKEHMYGIGSISKVFTVAAVMQLVEQGKVKLDTPVVNYLPEFKMADTRYKDITVRMLLNHSSGLMGSTFSNAELFDDNDTLAMNNLLQELSTQRLKADPGAFSAYCNDGFSLAQLLVEKVSGISFSEYIRTNMTDVLAMKQTKTPLDNFNRSQLVKTYLSRSSKALPTDNVAAIGAWGIYSTAEDLCRFAQMFMYNTENKVLSEESSRAMAASEYLSGIWCPEGDSCLSYGLGWDSVNTYPFTQYGIKALVKRGDTNVYHGSLIVLPEEGLAMAVLSSGGASTYNELMARQVLLQVLLAKGKIKSILPDKPFTTPVKTRTSMPASEKEYSGYYANAGGICKVEIDDKGKLKLTDASTSEFRYYTYTGNGKFYYIMDDRAYVSFVKESNGNTYLYMQGYYDLPNLGRLAFSDYRVQKITENKLKANVKAVWEKRNNKMYVLVNEKYSSQAYALSTPNKKITLSKDIEGYYGANKIIDANTAKMLLQIPGSNGWGLADTYFYKKDNIEYMKSSGALFMSENAVRDLSAKDSFSIAIGSDGYAKWYKIGPKSKYKKLKVIVPKNASYSVYDREGYCSYSSLTSDITAVTLPLEGYIVFAGEKGASFIVKYLK